MAFTEFAIRNLGFNHPFKAGVFEPDPKQFKLAKQKTVSPADYSTIKYGYSKGPGNILIPPTPATVPNYQGEIVAPIKSPVKPAIVVQPVPQSVIIPASPNNAKPLSVASAQEDIKPAPITGAVDGPIVREAKYEAPNVRASQTGGVVAASGGIAGIPASLIMVFGFMGLVLLVKK